MRVRRLAPASIVAVVAALAVAPATGAAPVDANAFRTQFDAAVSALMAQKGAATRLHMKIMDPSGGAASLDLTAVENANGSSRVTGSVFGFKSTIKCVTATRCWRWEPKTRKWSADGSPGMPSTDDLTAEKMLASVDPAATFDVDGSVFTLNDPKEGVVQVRFAGDTMTVTSVGGSGTMGAGATSTTTLDVNVPPVKVVQPPKRLIAKASASTSSARG